LLTFDDSSKPKKFHYISFYLIPLRFSKKRNILKTANFGAQKVRVIRRRTQVPEQDLFEKLNTFNSKLVVLDLQFYFKPARRTQ